MIKDPFDQSQTPYELLGLQPDACVTEVHQALPRFMRDRRNVSRLGKAQEAIRRLKTPLERAALDIWFYVVEMPAAKEDAPPPTEISINELAQPPQCEPQLLYTDLDGRELAASTWRIESASVDLADLKQYDGLDALSLKPDFDR